MSNDMVSNLHKIIIFWSFKAEILNLETSDIYIFAIIFKNKDLWQKKGIKNESYFLSIIIKMYISEFSKSKISALKLQKIMIL